MYLKLHPDDPETAELTRQAIESLNMEGHLTADAILRAIQEQNAKPRAILEKCDGRYFEIAREIEDFLFDFITSNKDKIVLERQIRSRLGVN